MMLLTMKIWVKIILFLALISPNPVSATYFFRDPPSLRNNWCESKKYNEKFAHSMHELARINKEHPTWECKCTPSRFTCSDLKTHYSRPYSHQHIVIEPNGKDSWYMKCKIASTDLIEFKNSLKSYNLRLGKVKVFAMNNCLASSYTNFLLRLGITSFDTLVLKSRTTKIPLNQDSFKDMNILFPTLKNLEIRFEGITSISSDTLQDFKNMETLKIQQTSIKSIPESLLRGLSKLKQMSLFWNQQLNALPPKLFRKNTKNLERLFINHHQHLNHIDEEQFMGLRNLSELDLGSNQLFTIPDKLLYIGDKIGSCNLKRFTMLEDSCGMNCHRYMPVNLLDSCRDLDSFTYSFKERTRNKENNSVTIPLNFMVPSTVTTLQINRANLSEYDMNGILSKLKNVEKLDFSQNNIQKIQEVDIPTSVKSLRLAKNPFECNCNVVYNLKQLMYARRCLDDGFIVSLNCSNMEDIQNNQNKGSFLPAIEYGTHANENFDLPISEAIDHFCKDYTPPRKATSTMDAISPNFMNIIRICINWIICILIMCGPACIFCQIARYKKSMSRPIKPNKDILNLVGNSKSTY